MKIHGTLIIGKAGLSIAGEAVEDLLGRRLIFNEGIPQDLGFVDRNDPAEAFFPKPGPPSGTVHRW